MELATRGFPVFRVMGMIVFVYIASEDSRVATPRYLKVHGQVAYRRLASSPANEVDADGAAVWQSLRVGASACRTGSDYCQVYAPRYLEGNALAGHCMKH